ncbi:NADH-quinone oxidoreductase subunit NuoG [Thalassotalea sediminis]|uniref:NADH-quinone oxidoreductase subunit NuoG n=1 Tax=Thalassotalea sediminis TaxID=1759089 RepID=UPI002572C898|nr:NADH-quinone oxidoreductase subunit NuoG [Thalassotalea sediminis]
MVKKLVTIFIDDIAYQIDSGDNLLAGVLSQKLNLPYFCWHPAMGSVGACRQCAVTQYQDENDDKGRLIMACTAPVTEGMRIGLNEATSQAFREQVISAMMTNHPHDCPVCAEGGECHLQDMTVMTGHSTRKYHGLKRTFTNQHLGQFIGHEMNRCITCYRCVRYYKDYAGGEDFGVFGTKNQVYFGRQQDGQLASEFSGNLVEVCPTGVFTNKIFSAHYARKWDLQSAPSICGNCAVGCNTSIGERYGSVRRVMNRYHHELNGYFLCDHGRFGLGYVNNACRIKQAKGIKQRSPYRLTKHDVLIELLPYRRKRFLAIGSARASVESNQLLKLIVGEQNFSSGFSENEYLLANAHIDYLSRHRPVSLAEVEQADFVLIVDEDITQSAPRIALAVRQALRNEGIERSEAMGIPKWQDSAVRTVTADRLSPLYVFSSIATKLDSVAKKAVLQPVTDSITVIKQLISVVNKEVQTAELADNIATLVADLTQAKKPLIIGGWSQQNNLLFSLIVSLIDTIKKVKGVCDSLMVVPHANTVGQLYLTSDNTPTVEAVIEQVEQDDNVAGIIVLENELTSVAATSLARLKALNKAKIVLEHSSSDMSDDATVVMPVTPISESHGHFANYQGRLQAFYPVTPAVLPVQNSWCWLVIMAQALDIFLPDIAEIENIVQLNQWFKERDENWPIKPSQFDIAVAREPHRASGRTAKMANQTVHEAKTTQSDEPFRFSMEGGAVDSDDAMPFVWAPGWNSNQAITKYQQQPNGPLMKRKAAAFLPFNNKFIQPPPINDQSAMSKPINGIATLAVSKPWYQRFWLTKYQPEFILLSTENKFHIAENMAQQLNVSNGEWATLSLFKPNSELEASLVGLIEISHELPIKHAFIETDEIDDNHWQIKQLTRASEQDVMQWKAQHEQAHQAAILAQKNELKQLKEQDQIIPIRFVAGGLDDV